eukprot:879252_1
MSTFHLWVVGLLFGVLCNSQWTLEGSATVHALRNQRITVRVAPNETPALVQVIFSGDSFSYIGFGFGSTTMPGCYSLITDGGEGGSLDTVYEYELAQNSRGTEYETKSITVQSNDVESLVRTIILVRPAVGQGFNFPTTAGSTFDIIWAYGPINNGQVYSTCNQMGGRGATTITLNPLGHGANHT